MPDIKALELEKQFTLEAKNFLYLMREVVAEFESIVIKKTSNAILLYLPISDTSNSK